MKALILVNNEMTLYNFRQEFLNTLIQNGYEVVISMPSGKYDQLFSEMGCKIIHTELSMHGMNPFKDFKLPKIYQAIIKKEKPNIVITYTIKPNIYGGVAAGRCKVPCISTVTGLGAAFEKGWLISKISYLLYRIGTRKTACVFFQNKAHSEQFARNGIAVGRHVIVAGSGVNLKKHAFVPYREEDRIRLLFVGRVTKDKGIDELIAAVRKIKENTDLPVSLELLGNIEAGYDEKISDCQKEGMLIYHGRHENVHDYIKDCSAVVLPSYHEGLANVLLEAAACGRPVIASKINGCIEAFDDGVTGIGCAPRDEDSLYDAIVDFAKLSKEQRAEMGRKGREKVEKEFDREAVNQIYLSKIDEICQSERDPLLV